MFAEFYVSLVLLPILKVWADPIVARGNVKSEILHYSKSIVAIVSHLQQDTLIKHKMKVVELVSTHRICKCKCFYIYLKVFPIQIAKGLPNHLSSTDPRSVFLAKFICDFLTQTMKVSRVFCLIIFCTGGKCYKGIKQCTFENVLVV